MIETFQTTPRHINSLYDFFYDCAIFLKQKLNITIEKNTEGETKNIILKNGNSHFKFSISNDNHVEISTGGDSEDLSIYISEYELFYGVLANVNNGIHWRFEVKSIDDENSHYTYFQIYSTQIISKTKEIFYSDKIKLNDYDYNEEFIYYENLPRRLYRHYQENVSYNFPNEAIVLTPVLLGAPPLNLIAPTIGNFEIYHYDKFYDYNYDSQIEQMKPYQEFYIKNERFVHLYEGIVIRSL